MEQSIKNSKRIQIAEQRALSFILNKPEEALNFLTEDSFIQQRSKDLFLAIKSLVNDKVELSELAVCQRVVDKVPDISIEEIKKIKAISQTENLADVFKDLQKATIQSKAAEEALILAQDFLSSDLNKDNLDEKVMSLLHKIDQINSDSLTRFQSLKEWLVNYQQKFHERQGKKQYPFGDVLMDKWITRGAAPGTIGIISASTGMGKSTVVEHIQSSLEELNVPSLLISLEMPGESLMDRRISSKYKIPFADIANPVDPDTFEKIDKIVENEIRQSDGNTIVGFSDLPHWNISQLRTAVTEFMKGCGADYCVVIIDLLTMLEEFCSARPGMNFAQSIEVSMNLMNALAKELNIHIIGTVQFGRKADSVKITDFDDISLTKPSLNDLKNSNAIAERSRYVIGLHRPLKYAETYLNDRPETQEMEDLIEFMVLKQNEGKTGSFYELFDPTYFTLAPVMTTSKDKDNKTDTDVELENNQMT